MLADQFQKKTLVNKQWLWCKLSVLQLKDGDSIQEHIKVMIKIFDRLSMVDDVIVEEDHVIYLVASSPDLLVTAPETNADIPKIEVITGRQRPTRKGPKC